MATSTTANSKRPAGTIAPLCGAWRLLRAAAQWWHAMAAALSDPYRPEAHYMRGPGPKSLAKLDGGAGRDAVSRSVNRGIPAGMRRRATPQGTHTDGGWHAVCTESLPICGLQGRNIVGQVETSRMAEGGTRMRTVATIVLTVATVCLAPLVVSPLRAENVDVGIRRSTERTSFTNDEIVEG